MGQGAQAVSEFGDALRAALEPPRPGERPFVCDGLPQSCDVLIVGENPHRRVTDDWLGRWWDDATGFDLKAFNAVYDLVRSGRGTRSKLDALRSDGLRCVETNVYRNERPNGAGPRPVDNLPVIRLLLESMPD